MGNFRANQKPSANPYHDGTTSPGFWGVSAIGGMTAVQANTDLDYYSPPYPAEVEGSEVILTQVVDWPFTEDDAGVSFDQAGLYGVRTRCWRQPIADGGGDRDGWVAVPKTLPSGYTAVGRCGILPAIYNDWLGENALLTPPTWNHRTASGLLLDTITPEGLARSYWTPRAYNRSVIEGGLGSPGIIAVPPGTYPADTYDLYLLDSNSPGFRGGKFSVSIVNGAYPAAYSGATDWVLAYMDNDEVINDPWTEGHPPANLHPVATFTVSVSFAVNEYGPTVVEVTLPSMDFGISGKAKSTFLYSGPYNQAVSYSLANGATTYWLSPRSDIPLWYFASTRNKCAPGGIIMP